MQPRFDMEPATSTLEKVVAGIREDQLDADTPCADTSVRTLLVHVLGLAEAFRQAATKESLGRSQAPDLAALPDLPPDWRPRIAERLRALTDAWRAPEAWDGETEAGGVREAAPVMATVALDELVVHGWDLARATGQPFDCADAHIEVLLEMLSGTPPEGVPGLFGPSVAVSHAAPPLHRVLGLTGRDPEWAG
ncbi:TIGR03086 family metal-binding protein [Nocardia shimofusensis]|uniref:TIGR03086 family metal-binding protein n=1 Tax=Nocardia shimofusensis TaxID=228596 RepID=UPI00082C6BB6|nr:TIGR03086 family metal-binding protein [Nocardia shimofusensis]